ncbi:MAG: hypothetical protein ISS58_05450 [Dehalococcoidales bacterium]|nr:hypothetical protein [Dehalococcoidales bacterium]
MSDIVQGALIAIAGTIVGAIITAIIAYINTRSQLNLRLYELRTDRLTKAREKVLIPLREAISQSLELSNNHLRLMVQMGEANKKEDKIELSEAIRRWEEASEKSKEADANLEILIGQLSDSQLLRMIEEVQTNQAKEGEKVIEVTVLAHQPESWNIRTMKRLNSELREIHNITLEKLLPVNKRIEELLSGEPSN